MSLSVTFLFQSQSFSFCSVVFKVATNGPRIGDSGGLESRNFQFCTNLSNSLLLFSKFMKKGNIKGCCDKKKEKLSISPLTRHFANTMLAVVIILQVQGLNHYMIYQLNFHLLILKN